MYFTYENHLGERIDFYGSSPYILTQHTFLDWQLAYNTSNNRSSGFRLDGREFDFTVRIMPRRVTGKARPQTFSNLINYFVSVVSADMDVPGKLYAKSGEYLEGRITVSNKSAWNIDKNVTLQCKFRADNPTWQYANTHHFDTVEQNTYEYLDYPYGFPFDYSATLPGQAQINSATTENADYIMTIYGSVSAPMVWLNGVQIGAYVTLADGDRLVINSRNKTVTKYSSNVISNEFNNRIKGQMFAQLEPGIISVLWSGLFEFDLSILEQRREPVWMI